MLKRDITYENFDGKVITKTFYFNLAKPELVELEFSHNQGFGESLKRIIQTNDNKTLINEFKRLILLSYGEKSADGERFIKTDQMSEEFSQTAAYNALFMELATDDSAATTFIRGILPGDMLAEFEKAAKAQETPEEMLRRVSAENEANVKQVQELLPPPPQQTVTEGTNYGIPGE